MITKPFDIRPSGNMWVCFNIRSGALASYPTTKAKAKAEAKYMNEQYAEIIAQDQAECA